MTTSLEERVRRLLADGRLDLPAIGEGRTPQRWRSLLELARHDVSEARLGEAHVDGRQILAEAGRDHCADHLLCVWASEHPRWTVTGEAVDGGLVLHGSKAFCTGAGLVDDALVTVTVSDQTRLVLVPVDDLDPRRIDTSGWVASALSDTSTAVVDLDGVKLGADALVGDDRWYLDRPGFWLGALGPAACWGGAAIGLVDHAVANPPTDPHGLAHLGAMVAAAWSITSVLAQSGQQIDAEAPGGAPDGSSSARRRALIVRHLIDQHAADIQDRFARALGPRALLADAAVDERYQALTIYRRQCHAERDLEALGALVEPALTRA